VTLSDFQRTMQLQIRRGLRLCWRAS